MRSISLLSCLIPAGALLFLTPAVTNAAPSDQTIAAEHSVMTSSLFKATNTFAQSSSDDSSSGGSTKIRTRGLGKLIGLVVVCLLAAGKFIIGFFTGGSGDE